jgi:hypothetical protein
LKILAENDSKLFFNPALSDTAARSRLVFAEPLRDATTAPNLIFNIGGLSKNVTNCSSCLPFVINLMTILIRRKNCPNPSVNYTLFKKVGLVYSRVGAGAVAVAVAASKFLAGAC